MTDATRFVVELGDGRIVHCQEVAAQEYPNGRISAGLLEGMEPDILYFRLHRKGEHPVTVALRLDEVTALIFSCSGALWAVQRRPWEDDGAA